MTALPAGVETHHGPTALRHMPMAAAAAAVLSQIALILVPEEMADGLTIASVLLFATASLSHAALTRGVRWAAIYAAVAAITGWTAEAIGTTTGFPFGEYWYADSLGPKIGPVPAVIPLAWLMMAYPVLLAARRVSGNRLWQIGYAAALLTAWDLFLDPQMVSAGHWVWQDSGASLPGIPGIPIQNFAGWFLVGLVLFGLATALLPRDRGPVDDRVPAAMLLWVFASNVMAHTVFWGNPSVALIGGAAMGALLVPWLRSGVASKAFWAAR
jgi:uncharacterized membrane protein